MTIEFFKLNYEIKCQNHMSIVLDMAKFDVFVETANQSFFPLIAKILNCDYVCIEVCLHDQIFPSNFICPSVSSTNLTV